MPSHLRPAFPANQNSELGHVSHRGGESWRQPTRGTKLEIVFNGSSKKAGFVTKPFGVIWPNQSFHFYDKGGTAGNVGADDHQTWG